MVEDSKPGDIFDIRNGEFNGDSALGKMSPKFEALFPFLNVRKLEFSWYKVSAGDGLCRTYPRTGQLGGLSDSLSSFLSAFDLKSSSC